MSRFNFNEITLSSKADITKVQENFEKIENSALAESDVVDNLTSIDTDKPLSANQGKVLDEGKANSTHTHTCSDITDLSTTLTNYKLKGDFAVITGTISITNGAGNTTANYPTGFTKDTCVPIAVGISFSTTSPNSYIFGGDSGRVTGARLSNDNIRIDTFTTDVGPSGTLNYKLVLMKTS